MKFHQYLKTEILRYPSKNQTFFLFTSLRCMVFSLFLKQFLNLTQTKHMTEYFDHLGVILSHRLIGNGLPGRDLWGFVGPKMLVMLLQKTNRLHTRRELFMLLGFMACEKWWPCSLKKNGHAKHGPGWKVPTNLIYSSILVEKEGHWCAGNGVFGIEVISYSHKTTYPTSSKLKKKTYPSLFKSLHVPQKGQKGQTCSTNVCSHPNFEPVYSEKNTSKTDMHLQVSIQTFCCSLRLQPHRTAWAFRFSSRLHLSRPS